MSKEAKIDALTEEQILDRLLNADAVPERTVVLERIGIPVKLKGLTAKQVYSIREMCMEKRTVKNKPVEKLDEEAFNCQLIASATVSPNWGAPALLAKYQASGASEVVKRLLLAGELSALGDVAMDLSGFNTDLDDVKN